MENLSADEADSFLAAGLHTELTTVVSRIRNLKTISRNSAIRYRDTSKSSKTIADELGVVNLLTGAVQRLGENIRINVQLMDVSRDRSIWGETYTRKYTPDNLFAIQSNICRAIARELSVLLTPEENRNIDQVPTENLEALETYFKGKEILFSKQLADMQGAIDLFEKAIELDPEFTLAYVGLAESILIFSISSIGIDFVVPGKSKEEAKALYEPLWEKALQASEKLLELNEDLSETQLILGHIQMLEDNLESSKVALDRALHLNPNNPEVYAQLTQWNIKDWSNQNPNPGLLDYSDPDFIATVEKQMNLLRKAVDLDPSSPRYRRFLADWHAILYEYEEEIEQHRLNLQHNPDFFAALQRLSSRLMFTFGRYDEGMIYLRKSFAASAHGQTSSFASAFKDLGGSEEALKWMEKSVALYPSRSLTYPAEILHIRGKEDESRELYEGILGDLKGFSNDFARMWMLNDALRSENYHDARSRYLAFVPELFESNVLEQIETLKIAPPVRQKSTMALELAFILKALGEDEQVDRLIDGALWRFLKRPPELNVAGSSFAKWCYAMIHVLKGENKQALKWLRDAVDLGWRDRFMLSDARLDALREEPEFIEMMKIVEDDMAQQLANIRRMEANGEFAAIPKLLEAR